MDATYIGYQIFYSIISKWVYLVAIILLYKLGKRFIYTYRLKYNIDKDKSIKESEYSEEKIIGHLDYIINETLDQYVIFNLQPKNIYYINSKIETDIVAFLSDKVPDRISSTLMQQLELIYNRDYIGEFIGSRIYMIVLNYVLDYNIKNSPDENARNATNAVQKNK